MCWLIIFLFILNPVPMGNPCWFALLARRGAQCVWGCSNFNLFSITWANFYWMIECHLKSIIAIPSQASARSAKRSLLRYPSSPIVLFVQLACTAAFGCNLVDDHCIIHYPLPVNASKTRKLRLQLASDCPWFHIGFKHSHRLHIWLEVGKCSK